MYLVTVFWFAADGWFDPTILGLFDENDFAHWRCTTGHFPDFPAQKLSEPLSAVATPSSGLKGNTKPIT